MTTTMDKTQTIDADALRARLAGTPADLRGRIYTAAEAQALLDALMAANGLQCAAGRPCRACDARIDAVRALTDAAPVLVATVTAQSAEVERLRAESERRSDLLDDVAHAHERDVLVVWAALGETHEPPENIAAVVGAVERLRALLAVTQASLEAASSGRRVTACDDIERLQRENATLRDAAREYLDARAAYDAADTYEATNADDERRAWERRAAAQGALRALVGGAS